MPDEKVNILLVDDEPRNLTALEAILDDPSLHLVRAESGQEALRQVLQRDFAVIVLDVMMPDMDGFETAEMVRARDRSRATPIIFLTAADRGEVAMLRGYALGGVDYLVKPFDAEILSAKVAVFVELHKRTEQVRRQADELAQMTALLNSILVSSTGYGINALDVDGRYLVWNEGSRRIYGYAAKEMVGKRRIHDIHRPEDVISGRVDALLEAARLSGKAAAEFDRVRKDGRSVSTWVTAHRRDDAQDSHVGYVVVSEDITERKEAEEQRAQLGREQEARAAAEAALRARDQFISIAAHELRTPIASLFGDTQALRRAGSRGHLDDARLARSLGRIEQAARRLTILTADLLDLSRIRAGHLELRPELVDLTDLVRQLAERYAEQLDGGSRLVIEPVRERCLVHADPHRLEQVLTNLLDNAVKYSPDGSEIRIGLAPERQGCVLTVRDCGMGLPSGAAGRIFEPFERAPNAKAQNLPGMGLGLTICRDIVERHGGRIWAESPGEGEGTTVSLWLPDGVEVAPEAPRG